MNLPRRITRDLTATSLDPGQWRSRTIDTVFSNVDAQQLTYHGAALVSEPAETQSIEFEFKTYPVTPVTLQFPLSVSSPAAVRFCANDQVVGRFELTASTTSEPFLHEIESDVTRATEPRKISRLQVRISYRDGMGTATILLGDDERKTKPCVIQTWSWLYAMQSFAFFILTWAIILAAAILIVVNLRSLGDTFRYYAVITTVIAWGCGVAGLSDLAKLPFQSLIRNLYGRTGRHRPVYVTALAFVFLPVIGPTARVVRGVYVRQQYSSLIHQAMVMNQGPNQDEVIRRAFVLQPWRKEAQSLFERRAWLLRRDDMIGFRQYVRQFVLRPDVKNAVVGAPSYQNLPFYFDRSADEAFSNPVLWYANLLPEADEDDKYDLTEAALSLLSTGNSEIAPEAKIFRVYLLLGFAQRERKRAVGVEKERAQAKELELVNELSALLTDPKSYSEVAPTQTYQMGCDILGCYYILHCQQREATTWFNRELQARNKHQTASDLPLWQRPPNKLRLYHMFLLKMNTSQTRVVTAQAAPVGEDTSPDPRKHPPTDSDIAKQLLRWNQNGQCQSSYEKEFEMKVFNANERFQHEENWLAGTILAGDKLDTLNILLSRGWRY